MKKISWFFIVLLLVWLLGRSWSNRPQTVNYTEFLMTVEKGNVLRVEVISKGSDSIYKINFSIKDEKSDKEKRLTTFGFLDANLIEKIRKKNKEAVISYQKSIFSLKLIILYAFLILAPLIILIIIVSFVFQRLAGDDKNGFWDKGLIKFKATEVNRKVNVALADVGGLEEEINEIKLIVEYLKDPQKFQKIGGKMPKGILLSGPPGTGKTLLAQAIAGEANVPLFSITGSQFVEIFVGVGAARVRDLFEKARQKQPCIIFIDEIDAIGKTRSPMAYGGESEREQTLNQLLNEMDGFSTRDQAIIVMAATNRIDVLDKALLRRFSKIIVLRLPDIRGREQILKIHLRGISYDEKIDISKLAALTVGFSGADIARLVNEAALIAVRKNKKKVELTDLLEAREKLMFGIEKRIAISQKEKEIIAYHEAGHAVVSEELNFQIEKISIISRGEATLGYTSITNEEERFIYTEEWLKNRIVVLLAGFYTEEFFFKERTSGASDDIKKATAIAREMVIKAGMSNLGPLNFEKAWSEEYEPFPRWSEKTFEEVDREIKKIINEAEKRVKELIEKNKENIKNLAEELIRKETLTGEIKKFFKKES